MKVLPGGIDRGTSHLLTLAGRTYRTVVLLFFAPEQRVERSQFIVKFDIRTRTLAINNIYSSFDKLSIKTTENSPGCVPTIDS